MNDKLTHLDSRGEAIMVDVSAKDETRRTASAEGRIRMNEAAFAAVSGGTAAKGDVLAVARVAGIMAVKKTADLIPLCHTIPIEKATVQITAEDGNTFRVVCDVVTSGKTGVEMEALSGASAALLTLYDMTKALDRGMEIFDLRLLHKSGGRRGDYAR